ncbi:MAG: divalent cation tolerance protein CutA [Candidatus Cloacimonadaceae bacterium]
MQVKNLQNEYVIVMVTAASKREAENIAQRLLQEKLIACANLIGPVTSIFHWSGKTERAEEYLMFMKSRKDLFKKLVEAVINAREFFLREAQLQRFPKGLFYILSSFGLWNHGGDPTQVLAFEGYLKELKKGIKKPLFEELIQACFIDNPHASEIHFIPVPGLIARQDEAVKAELAEHKAALSKKEITKLIQLNTELKAWQEEPDSEADLLKIPLLKLSDVDVKAPENPTEVEAFKEFKLLKHPINTNGIVYFKQYFNLEHAKKENFPWIMLYTQLLGMVNTQNYSYGELYNEIQTHTGGITLNLNVVNSFQTPDEVIPLLTLHGKALTTKMDKLLELSAEFTMNALFDDPARLKTLIRELKTNKEAQIIQGAVQVAIRRMFAPFSELHELEDDIHLLGYYHFLSELEERLESEMENIMEELKWIQGRFINLNKSIISITANESQIPELVSALPILLNKMPNEEYEPVSRGFETQYKNEGIAAPIKVQYVIKGGNFFRKGFPYSGKLRVLGNILSTEYLYKELRVKGGAYGGGASFTPDGYQYFYSYRDPNLKESLDVYNGVADYIRKFDCSRREMEKYILGDISAQDYPQTPEAKGSQGDMDYIRGFTQADRQQIRDEVLATTPEDLRVYADMVQNLMSHNHYAVFGGEDAILANKELFDVITKVIRK